MRSMSIRRDDLCGSGEAHVDRRAHRDDCVGDRVSLRDGFSGVWEGLQGDMLGLSGSQRQFLSQSIVSLGVNHCEMPYSPVPLLFEMPKWWMSYLFNKLPWILDCSHINDILIHLYSDLLS